MTKIDLAEIEKTNNLIKSRCNDIENYGKIGVPGKDDVCIRYMQAKQIATALEALPKLVLALQEVVEWKNFPETGKFWDKEGKEPMSYGAAWGSNGERDFMRNIAKEALTPFETTKTVEP